MRLFIGIKLDSKCIKKIDNYYKFFYSENVSGNYTSLENLHLTLNFLGELDENRITEITSIINSVKLEISELEIIKFTRLKDMLVGEVKKTKELMNIYNDLTNKLKQRGFKINDYPFYPHITLIRQVKGLRDFKFIDSQLNLKFNFTQITLFESTRINNKLVYIPKN